MGFQQTLIKCIVDVGFGEVSCGELKGKIIRCYLIAREDETYEITVSFTEMETGVREFLSGWVESILPDPVKAEASAAVSEDSLTATIELQAPQNNGPDLTYDELCACLDSLKVSHGVDYDLLRKMSETPHYNYRYIVARSTPPVHGADAELIYHVDLNPSFTPKVNEQGNVDFKDIGQVHTIVEAGNDPELIIRYETIGVELEELIRELEPIRESIRFLTALKYKNEITEEKLVMLMYHKALAQQLSEKQDEVTKKSAAMKEVIDSLGYGTISVKELAHGGFKGNHWLTRDGFTGIS